MWAYYAQIVDYGIAHSGLSISITVKSISLLKRDIYYWISCSRESNPTLVKGNFSILSPIKIYFKLEKMNCDGDNSVTAQVRFDLRIM